MRIACLAHRSEMPWYVRAVGFACAWLCLFLAVAQAASADGFIIPDPPPHVREVPNLSIKYHRVRVAIDNQIALTEVDQVFVNDSPYDLEGTYIFPLPEEAAISEFAMYVDGERLSGRVLDKDEARRIYQSIVDRRRDPALLEYVGRNAFQARVYPIPAHGDKRVQLSYSEVLLAERGLVHYVYPLDTERFSSRALEEVVITVDLHSAVPIKAIYSPSHKIVVERSGEKSARVSFEATNVLPDADFQLYYSISDDDVGLNLLSYKERGEDGFFLLLVAPEMKAQERTIVAKDVVFVLDTSGSMEGQKLEQAKAGLEFILDRLNPDDRFNIVAFSTGIRLFYPRVQPASARKEALSFVQDLEAGGGTDIDRALEEALHMATGERPQFVIFLTDGLPTEGVTDPERIIAMVEEEASDRVRLFTFGVGYDVNTVLLDTISQEHRGASAYVEPGESLEEEIATFYAKISTPLLSDLRLEIDGVLAEDMYPYPVPDLFAGSQLLLAGRYRRGGEARITLHGTVNGEDRAFVYPEVVFTSQGGPGFIARLWATRKIGHMLKEIRLHGESEELVDHIVSLSVRYGIMTPYTSFLVDADEEILTDAGRERIAMQSPLVAPSAAPAVGERAVADSQTQSKLAEADRGGGSESTEIKWVEDKAFVLRDGVWTDTTYDPQTMALRPLAFGSPAYYGLLAQHPHWGRYFALGEKVIVVLDQVAYQVVPDTGEPVDAPPAPPTLSPWEQFWEWFRSVIP